MENADDDTSRGWLVGFALCAVSSLGTGLSKLAIRKSWLLQQKQIPENHLSRIIPTKASHERKSRAIEAQESLQRAKRMRWAALFFMTFWNPLLDITAFAFASPSILAPFSGVSLAWVILLSKRMVGEQPSRLRVVGALLIMTGEVIISVFGDHTSHSNYVTMEQVRDSYRDPAFVKFIVVSLLLEAALQHFMHYATNCPYITRLAWGIAGGLLTGFQNFIKDVITMLQVMDPQNRMRPWQLPWYFFGLLLGAGLTAGTGLFFLAACMKRYDATYASGTFAGSLTLTASIMSAIHYQTFDRLNQSIGSHLLYPVGLIVLMTGVGFLMHHSHDNPEIQGTFYEPLFEKDLSDCEAPKQSTFSGARKTETLAANEATVRSHMTSRKRYGKQFTA